MYEGILCGIPEILPYTHLDASDRAFESQANYTCINGTQTDSGELSFSIQCQSDGTWTSTRERCEGKALYLGLL